MSAGSKSNGPGDRLIRGLGRRLAALLSENGQPADRAKRPSSKASVESRSPAGPADSRDFLERVRTALSEQTELVAGRVNFVDFERIKARLGPRWEKLAVRADEIARREIERHLTPADIYTALPDMRYLISFASLSPEAAKLRCAMIGEEITKKLLGEDFGDDVPTIQTAVSRVDGELEFENVPSLQAMAEELYRKVAEIGGEAQQPTKPQDVAIEELLQEDPLKDVQLVYRPMWDVVRNVVSTYILVPATPRAGGRMVIGEGAIFNIEDPKVVCELDLLVMRRALLDLKDILTCKSPYLLGVPLHFESVATAARRTDFIKLCKVIPADLRKLLLFELVDVPAGIPQSRILELTTMLKRYCRAVLMRLPLENPRFRSPPETGVSVVGVELSGTRLSERHVMKSFDRFCDGAQKAGLGTYVHGLRTLSLTTASIASGFHYVDGDMVVSVTDEPGGLYRFNMREVVRRWSDE